MDYSVAEVADADGARLWIAQHECFEWSWLVCLRV